MPALQPPPPSEPPAKQPPATQHAPRQWRTVHKAVLAGGVAFALSGAGAAAVWAGTASPSPSPSVTESAPSGGEKSGGEKLRDEKPRGEKSGGEKVRGPFGRWHGGEALHGEHVVKNPEGGFETVVTQKGSIESVSGTEITVKSEDGFSQRYAITGDTRILKLPALGEDGRPVEDASGNRARPSEVSAGELKAGDPVRLSGARSGDTVTARQIVEGTPAAHPGRGHGKGHGPLGDSRTEPGSPTQSPGVTG